jgi:hypothetical protein
MYWLKKFAFLQIICRSAVQKYLFLINNMDPDPNPVPKLRFKLDPDPKKLISDPQHCI